MQCEFLKKFATPTFDYYSGMSDLAQHIRQFLGQDVTHSRNDPLLCLTIPSSLKGVISDWFYSKPPHSLHNFEEVTEVFLTQYTSRQEAKKNKHHLLTVKMRQGDSLKSYISYFKIS